MEMLKNYILAIIGVVIFIDANAQITFSDQATALDIGVAAGTSFLGNGVTFHDYDDDGWDDITLNTHDGERLRFFKNVNGTFVEEVLLTPAITYRTKQANWVDIDNDGDKDLFVTSDTDGNRLFENTGSMAMVDISAGSGIPTTNMYTYGASWGDYNNDGFLDVYISNRDEDTFSIPNFLYENNGDNTFTDVSVAAGLNPDNHSSFCSAFFDFNNDGFQDIFVANDRYTYENYLYKNNGDNTFTDVGLSSGAGIFMDAMSATIGDYNHDGWQDIYITNTAAGNVFLRNNGNETFQNIAVSTGTTFEAIGWGATFLDAENDMDEDLYVSGLLDGNPSLIPYAFYENNNDGTFSEPTSVGFEIDNSSSFSNAVGDLNNDGLFDLVVANNNGDNIFLWENETVTTNNWLKIKLEGTASNRDGIGSVIEIGINGDKQFRYTLCGEGYLSQNSESEIFGLGSNTEVDYIKITWLSGTIDYFFDVSANQLLEITEGTGETLSNSQNTINDIQLYPNPAINNLSISSMSKTIKTVSIFNMLGQNISTKNYNDLVVDMDISFLQSGTYIIKVSTLDRKSNFKLIKE